MNEFTVGQLIRTTRDLEVTVRPEFGDTRIETVAKGFAFYFRRDNRAFGQVRTGRYDAQGRMEILSFPPDALAVVRDPRPEFVRPPRPSVGVVGSVAVAAFQTSRGYEVAAWYDRIDVPAQTLELHASEADTPEMRRLAYGSLAATIVYSHTPSLYGGVIVGNGNSGEKNEPTTVAYRYSFENLRLAAERGIQDATFTPLGFLWLAYAEAFDMAIADYRAALADWKYRNDLPETFC